MQANGPPGAISQIGGCRKQGSKGHVEDLRCFCTLAKSNTFSRYYLGVGGSRIRENSVSEVSKGPACMANWQAHFFAQCSTSSLLNSPGTFWSLLSRLGWPGAPGHVYRVRAEIPTPPGGPTIIIAHTFNPLFCTLLVNYPDEGPCGPIVSTTNENLGCVLCDARTCPSFGVLLLHFTPRNKFPVLFPHSPQQV